MGGNVDSAVSILYRGLPKQYQRRETFFARLVSRALEHPVELMRGTSGVADVAITSTHPSDWRKGVDQFRRVTRRWASPTNPNKSRSSWDVSYSKPMASARVNIWTSGENVRPPIGDWTVFLSHDLDGLDGRNIYLPFWIEATGIYATPTVNFLGDRPTLQEMLSPRSVNTDSRPKFACAFLGKAGGLRHHAISALTRLGPVDVFGPAVGRPVPNKFDIARDYRFMLCFENDLYPGYVTEKPFDAWATGAIPLWWGSDPAGFVNPRAVVNLARFPDLSSFVDHIGGLAQDQGEIARVAGEPILAKAPDMPAIEGRLRDIIGPKLGIP